MLEVKDKRHYLNIFDNITDLTCYLKRPIKQGRRNESDKPDKNFSGTNNYAEALELLTYGDEKLLKEIKENSKKMKIEKMLGNCVNRQSYEQRVYGCVPNVPAYLMGNPINMINPEKNKISHKIINIFLNISCAWNVSANEITRMGTIYLNVIDMLEKKGYRCNLYAGDFTEDYDDCYQVFMTRIKTDREPLNIKKMAFPLAHPSMLRRIYFRWAEVHDYNDMTNDGYGQPFNETAVIKEVLQKDTKEDFLVFSYKNTGETIEQVLDRLKKQGIDLEI